MRKRALPGRKYDESHEPWRSRCSVSRRSLFMRFSAKISVWNGVRFSMAGSSGTGTSSPAASTCGGRSTVMLRSDTLSWDSSIAVRRSSISDFRMARSLLVQLVGRCLQQRLELRLVIALVVGLLGADPALCEDRHDRVVERLHAELLARLDGRRDLDGLALADQVAHGGRGHHELPRRAGAPSVLALGEILRPHYHRARVEVYAHPRL